MCCPRDALRDAHPPHFVHTVVGTPIWQACWKEREGRVGDTDVPPHQLLRVAFHVALTLEQSLIDQATEAQRQAADRTLDEASLEQRKRQRT